TALVGGHLLDDVRDVRRVEEGELRAWHGDAHALLGRVRVERLDEVPGDDPARQAPPEEALGQTLRADAPQQPAQTDICPDEAELTLDVGELQVIHAHDLRAVRI